MVSQSLQFKIWLESTAVKKKRLVVYDFDGTVANVPERPSKWEGKDWWGHEDSLSEPHYDGGVNDEVVDSFMKDRADPDTDAILLTGRRGVIAHGVRKVLKNYGLYGKRVIPDSNKMVQQKYQSVIAAGKDEEHPEEEAGHREYYSGDHSTEEDYPKTEKGKPDGTTIAFKLYIIEKKMMYPEREVLEFWDDRADHIPHICKCGLDMLKLYGADTGRGNLKTVILHRVFPPAYRGGQGTVQHIPIRPGMVY
jgi:hypothetical protein